LSYEFIPCPLKFKYLVVLQGKKGVGKKIAPAPLAVKKEVPKRVVNPLFEKKARNFGIGIIVL
jgi:large subunit ribosomal protein L7Ae